MASLIDGRFTDPAHNFYYNKSGHVFKSSPKTPAAPDPATTAAAQTSTNKDTAWYNALLQNMNQETPYGNLTYTNNGDQNNPQFTSKITLSPEQQQLYDTQSRSENALASLGESQLGRISDSVSTPYSYAGLGDAPTTADINQLSQQGQDAIMARLNPQFGQDEEALRARLINQGIGQGSEAYTREMNTFNQAKNDARNQAIIQGANYGGTLQNQSLANRNQAIQEYNAQRNAPLNEYTAMTSGTQVQNPSFSSGGNAGTNPVDYANLVNQQYQAQIGKANAQTSANNSTTSGLFGLAGSLGAATAGSGAAGSAGWLAMLSDRKAKTNIVKVGEKNGFNIYQFSYKDGISNTLDTSKTYEGVMADEVKQIMPDAVQTHKDGYDRVNYGMIGLKMKEVA